MPERSAGAQNGEEPDSSRPTRRWLDGNLLKALLLFLAVAVPATGGILVFVDALFDGVDGVDGLSYASAIAVSPDGTSVYATGYGEHALTFLTRGPNGRLVQKAVYKDDIDGVHGMRGPWDVAVAPNGSFVFVASYLDNAIAVFQRAENGSLTFRRAYYDGAGGIFGLYGASGIDVSPDNRLVLVSSFHDGALAVFSRDATGDRLYLRDVELASSGIPTLDGAVRVRGTHDGSHYYVTSSARDAITIFSKDPTRDAVVFTDSVQDPPFGSGFGLDGAYGIAIDDTGKHLYVTGYDVDTIAAFERNPSTGLLAFIDKYQDGVDGVTGIQGANDCEVTPSGASVLVTGSNSGAVVEFSRNPATGRLAFSDAVFAGDEGVVGLTQPWGIAVTRDERNLYVVDLAQSSAVSFSSDTLLFSDTFELGDTSAWSGTVGR